MYQKYQKHQIKRKPNQEELKGVKFANIEALLIKSFSNPSISS